MDASFLDRFLKHIHENGRKDAEGNLVDPPVYENPPLEEDGEPTPIKIVLGLENGNVIRGHVVSAEQWFQINTAGNFSAKRVDKEVVTVEGSWPAGVAYRPDDAERFSTIYLTMVEFLSGNQWVSGCSVGIKTDKVSYCGDQYL